MFVTENPFSFLLLFFYVCLYLIACYLRFFFGVFYMLKNFDFTNQEADVHVFSYSNIFASCRVSLLALRFSNILWKP